MIKIRLTKLLNKLKGEFKMGAVIAFVTPDTWDDLKSEVTKMRNRHMTYAEISKRLAMSATYARKIDYYDSYKEFRDWVNNRSKEYYTRQRQRKAENAKAKEWSDNNKYVFGQKVTVLENTETKKEAEFTDDVTELAWKLVAKYSDDQDVRALLEAVILKKNRS